jgi:NAD(P)H-flavin reductase
MTPINPYLPSLARILAVVEESPEIRSFQVVLCNEADHAAFTFEPGQVAQLSVFGAGEATFVINSPPTRKDYLQFSVMRVGEVTGRLHMLHAGDKIGLRGPLGNWFPYQDMRGKDVVFVAGGIGMAPLRTLLLYMMDHREDYGRIRLVYGARNAAGFCYRKELEELAEKGSLELTMTVDQKAPDWDGVVGLVPNVLLDLAPSPENSVAVTCGPPIMIRYTLQALEKLGFSDDDVVTTLERRMKCGVGLCGRCNIGGVLVCVDGPVFTRTQLKALPDEF